MSETAEIGEIPMRLETRRGTVTQLPQRKSEMLQTSKERAEKIKARINKRKKEWEDFLASLADENYEDPSDVAAIKEAQEKIGDFKLKSAKDYSVPEKLRVNAERKREQLRVLKGLIHDTKEDMNRRILCLQDFKVATIDQICIFTEELKSLQSKLDPSLHIPVPEVPKLYPVSESRHSLQDSEEQQKESELTELVLEMFKMEEIMNLHLCESLVQKIHYVKEDINRRLLSLRDFKVAPIDQICIFIEEVKSLQSKLDPSLHIPVPKVPKLYPDEVPEKKLEYSKDTLYNYENQAKREAKHTDVIDHQGGFGEFAGFSANNIPSKSLQQTSASSVSVSESRHSLQDSEEQQKESELTELELEMFKMEEIRNLHLQESLVQKINGLIDTILAEYPLLHHQKLNLDLQMKLAGLGYITLSKELRMLEKFDKQETVLQEKVNSRISEKQEVQRKSEEYQQQLEAKKREIAKMQEHEKVIDDAFHLSLGENNKFADFLTTIFKKKVKRIKKKEQKGEEGEEDESEDESDEEFEWDSEDEDIRSDNGMLDDSVCPPDCDPELFENTLQLREKRLDLEEAISEEKKAAENLKKDYDSLAKKVKEFQRMREADIEERQRLVHLVQLEGQKIEAIKEQIYLWSRNVDAS